MDVENVNPITNNEENEHSEAIPIEVIPIEYEGNFENGKMLPPPVRSFDSREKLLNYIHDFSFSQGYATTIRDSERDKYVTIGCDRGGTYRNRTNIPLEERKKKSGSRLINCPFRIKGVKLVGGSWILRISNGTHNHEASKDMSGHPSFRRFSNEEFLRIKDMCKAGIPSRQVLTLLRQANPKLRAISRTVYNTKAKIRKEKLRGRTPIQALLEELSGGGFLHNIKVDMEGRLTHLFFAHPHSIKLSRNYSNVFVMDCTYKTNKFKMPLLDIIGVSSFNTSFYSCFVFLSKEEECDYAWALTMFKKMLGSKEPTVIVTDRELALMNAIEVIFPRTTNLLCFWHVETNIITNCKRFFEAKEDWDTFITTWTELVQSNSMSSFSEGWKDFEASYKEKVVMIDYIKKTWLPLKERFVKAWTDVHLHFGNRVTSRAEGAHGVLKSYLQVSTSDLHVAKEKICLAVENNFHGITTQVASEKIRIPHNICVPFFKELVHCVSTFALKKLFEQYKLALSDSWFSVCKGQFTATMGLPCAHMMRCMKDRALQLSDIHPQWRIDKLSFEDGDIESNNETDDLTGLFQKLEKSYHQWPIAQKEYAQAQLSQLINSSVPVVFDPPIHPHKGRPSNSNTKKVAVSSTRRDPSGFEIVEKSRKCSICHEVGHNSRTCKHKNADPECVGASNSTENNLLDALDLNCIPCDADFFLLD
ncbi:hypothetical protein AQUCO_04100189v1 [Aquilegia coerulea]|uniref:MULE transposase domain-containing protein n=1 Tax=Aquilegia coerulea TaxID=218851 RepID=A0A2G5C282_AQUCA|nr:hypothetical protein AQUCO_14200004v1 [Aquilegia coerulea]PIA33582.1 hypothetical protein AQUCO_04100189v1 [Aquilegia coerulea]